MLMTHQDEVTKELQNLATEYGSERDALISILQKIQSKYHFISDFTMQALADLLNIHPVEVYSIVTFYSFLSEHPQGKFIIKLCRSISCDMAGKDSIARQLENDLGIKFSETTADGRFTLKWVNCIGACDKGPAMLVNDQLFEALTLEKIHDIINICEKSFGPHPLQEKKENTI